MRAAGLKIVLLPGQDTRPTAGNGLDELRIFLVDRVRDRELGQLGFLRQLHHTSRITLFLQVRAEFIAPLDDDPVRRIAFKNLAAVGQPMLWHEHLPLGTLLPGALLMAAEPVELLEFGLGERVPHLLLRAADIGHIDERTAGHDDRPSLPLVSQMFSVLPVSSIDLRLERTFGQPPETLAAIAGSASS